MIVGIGCDIVDHGTTKLLNWDSKHSIQTRIFSEAELSIRSLNNKIAFLSGRYAAKEAIVKCLGTALQDGITLTDIQILQSEEGKPQVELVGSAKEIAIKMGIKKWHVSITHSNDSSLAFVVAES